MTQNELSEAGHNLLNDVQKIVGSKNIPQPTSDDLDKIATREWKLGYQYANWEWREKIQKAIDNYSFKPDSKDRLVIAVLTDILSNTSDQPDKSLDADGWISVEEKLPDEEIEFLGWDGYYESVMYLSEGCFYYRNDYEAKPTHWRILPEPPKQQKP